MEKCVLFTKLHLLKRCFRYQYISKRNKFKLKRNQHKSAPIPASDRALDHFDLYYNPVYGKIWPSMRIALLTEKKMCAVMNNFCTDDTMYDRISSLGAYDIIHRARQKLEKQQQMLNANNDTNNADVSLASDQVDSGEQLNDSYIVDNDVTSNDTDDAVGEEINSLENSWKDIDRRDLDAFVPAKILFSDQDPNNTEERSSVFTPTDIKIDIVKRSHVRLPEHLKVLAFPAGSVETFPDLENDRPGGHLCHLMLDAASVLPVIALDLGEGDSVLDLCAAPGGKTMCMLQTQLIESLTCNDLSRSRALRLQNILRSYLPEEDRLHVSITKFPGQQYEEAKFDKVLVDVPCSTDRHVLLVDENNLYSPRRSHDRLQMPSIQAELLLAGIKSCKPGGCVVYSTCTLSPLQNDGVIQTTLETLWRSTNIDVVVEDLSVIANIFKDTYRFYKECRFGQLIIPSLSKNFGPMYFSRIRRIN